MCWVRVHLDAQALTGVHQIKAASGSKTNRFQNQDAVAVGGAVPAFRLRGVAYRPASTAVKARVVL